MTRRRIVLVPSLMNVANLRRDHLPGLSQISTEISVRQSLFERPDRLRELRSIHCPTLAFCVAEDSITPPKAHREMSRLWPDACLVVLPDSVRLSSMEKGTEAARAVVTLLNLQAAGLTEVSEMTETK